MNDRIARLEKTFDGLQAQVGAPRKDVATLKENVRHLPTKPWMFATLAGTIMVIVAAMGLLIRFLPHAG